MRARGASFVASLVTRLVANLVAILVAPWPAVGAERPAAREPSPGVAVTVLGCSDELTARLPALVNLEVDVLMRERGATRGAPETVVVRCGEPGDGDVGVEVALAGARRASRVALGGMAPEHRARALALAIAELGDALSAAPPPPVPPPPVESRSPSSTRSPSLLAGGTVEWLGRPAAVLLGGRLTYQHRSFDVGGAFVTPLVSLGGSAGEAAVSAGQVAVRTVTGGVHLLTGTVRGHLRVEAGPGFRFGWGRLTGETTAASALEGRSLSAWWGGPEVCLRTTAARGGARLALELAAGWAVLPTRGLIDGGPTAYALQGTWLSATLQFGLSLGGG